MKSIRPFLILAFWTGCVLLGLGQVITFRPGAETAWFTISAGLCFCGILLRARRYSIAALFCVAASIALSVWGYRHGQQYQAWLMRQPPQGEQVRQVREQLQSLDHTNAEPGGAANRSQSIRSETNRTSAAAGSGR